MKQKVNGNTAGIRDTMLAEMAVLYELPCSASEFVSVELMEALSHYTQYLNRELLIYLSRSGSVEEVRIGDSGTVDMPDLRLVRNLDRLCGVRCIHTHPGGDSRLSDVDLGSLQSLRLDAMAAIGVMEGKPVSVSVAFIGDVIDGKRATMEFGPYRPWALPQESLIQEIQSADARLMGSAYAVTAATPDKAVLCGIEGSEGYDTLSELAALCQTAGLEVVACQTQRRRSVDSATYIGAGKAKEIGLIGAAAEADVFVFDDELSAVQMKNLEELLGAPIIDRTMLILDIFATRATSREGKLQVELAQLKYRLPRLIGMGRVLSRQGASGVGMRGPGEKKLEIDRRRIRRRIFELEQSLKEIEKQRALRRNVRTAHPIPVVALVGYTNAGKSTLLNALSGAEALAEDKLFATLDPVVRRVQLPSGTECLLSDTVGFINKLPHDLVEAFHSTLEEVAEADLILHVIDSSSAYYDVQMRVVEDVLSSLGASETPRLNVYNKMDAPNAVPNDRGEYIHISAKSSDGLDALAVRIEQLLANRSVQVELVVPYDKYDVLQQIRTIGSIQAETHESDGTHITALIGQEHLWRIKRRLE